NGPASAPQPGTKPMSKMDGVRRTLRDLGRTAMPLQIQDHLKKNYGIDMTVAHISNYKSEILRKKKGKKKAAKTAEAAPAAKSSAAPTTSRAAGAISLEDLQTTKALVARVGADQLRSLIDLLK